MKIFLLLTFLLLPFLGISQDRSGNINQKETSGLTLINHSLPGTHLQFYAIVDMLKFRDIDARVPLIENQNFKQLYKLPSGNFIAGVTDHGAVVYDSKTLNVKAYYPGASLVVTNEDDSQCLVFHYEYDSIPEIILDFDFDTGNNVEIEHYNLNGIKIVKYDHLTGRKLNSVIYPDLDQKLSLERVDWEWINDHTLQLYSPQLTSQLDLNTTTFQFSHSQINRPWGKNLVENNNSYCYLMPGEDLISLEYLDDSYQESLLGKFIEVYKFDKRLNQPLDTSYHMVDFPYQQGIFHINDTLFLLFAEESDNQFHLYNFNCETAHISLLHSFNLTLSANGFNWIENLSELSAVLMTGQGLLISGKLSHNNKIERTVIYQIPEKHNVGSTKWYISDLGFMGFDEKV